VGLGNVSVARTGNTFTVTFVNGLGSANQNQLNTNGGVGGTTVSVATVSQGAPPGGISGAGTFHKEGTGPLILPYANRYTASTVIEQGWVTVQNNQSLGGTIAGGETIQPGTSVLAGAALHLKAISAGANLNLVENLTLQGTGVSHAFGLIS